MPRPRTYATAADRQRAYRQRKAQAQDTAASLPPPAAVANMASIRRWNALRDQARSALQTMQEEMQSYFDDRSETWQESERGQELQEHIAAVEQLIADLDAIE